MQAINDPMQSDARKSVLESLIGEMDDKDAGKLGAKPLLTITIAAGDEGQPEAPDATPEHEAMESPEMESQEHATGEEMMDPRLEELIKKKKGY